MTILPIHPAQNASPDALRAFLTQCRDAAVRDGRAKLVSISLAVDALDSCGVYVGTTGGQVYVSADSGDTWVSIVRDLPAVVSVEAQTLP